MSNPIGLAERISRAKRERENPADREIEKQLLESLPKTQKWTPEHVDNRTPEQVSGQVSRHVDTWTPEQVSEQQDNRTPGHLDNRTRGHLDNRTREHLKAFDPGSKPKDLKPNQYRILYELYFNRPFKVKGPHRIGGSPDFPIPYGTVRNCLKSLLRKGYISKPFSINDGVRKGTTCQVNESRCVPIFGVSTIVNSEQVITWTREQQDTWTREHLDNRTSEHLDASYRKKESLLKNLSFYVEQSPFWQSHGLTIQKCEKWIRDIPHCDPEFLLQQLQFAEATKGVQNAKDPIGYFFSTIKKDAFHRPEGFEFPEERAARIRDEELKCRCDLLRAQEEARKREQDLADRESFLLFLDDKDAVSAAIEDIENQVTSPKMKAAIQLFKTSGKIDSRLAGRLKNFFFVD
jgi:hypothetical protein